MAAHVISMDHNGSSYREYIKSNSIKAQGGRLKATDIVKYINNEFNVNYSIQNVYRLLHQLNFSWITSRSRHPKQSEKVQEDFKKIRNGNDPDDPVECKA